MQKPIVEKVFEYKGYKCAVLFQPMAHRCGYVRIPYKSKYFKKEYDEIPVETHGGLTYSRSYISGVGESNDIAWWIGWDYAHCHDGSDLESYRKYYGEPNPRIWYPKGKIYYEEDVVNDCKYVVNQLIDLERGK